MRKNSRRVLLALGWYNHRVLKGPSNYDQQAECCLCAYVAKKNDSFGLETLWHQLFIGLSVDEDLANCVVETKLPRWI